MGVIKILCGLPACGKTFYANKQKGPNTLIVDCDSITKNGHLDESQIYQGILNRFYGNYKKKTVVLDGLFLTIESVALIVQDMTNLLKNAFTFEVEYWSADRDLCLKNDNGRRNENSRFTILNGVLDEMTSEKLKEATGLDIPVHIHKTVLKENYKALVDNMMGKVVEDRYLESSSWFVSAEYPEKVYIYAKDTTPSDFLELDEILETYFPTITYLQYKRLKRECIEVKTFDDSDYYSGRITYAKYRCDLKKLYEFIKERSDRNELPCISE